MSALRALCAHLAALITRWPTCTALTVVWALCIVVFVARGGPLL